MRNSLNRIGKRLDTAEEKISKLKGKIMENIQTKHREKKSKKKLTGLRENTKWPTICIFLPKGRKEREGHKIIQEIIA